MSFKDRTYCASPNCNNECGRRMSIEDKEELKELAFRGFKASSMVSYGYFCENELSLRKDEDNDKECA